MAGIVGAIVAPMQLTPGAVAVAVGVLVGGFVLWRASKAAGEAAGAVVDAVGTAAQYVKPLNPDNIFAGGVNAAGGSVMSQGGPTTAGMNADGSWTLGGYIYDMTHRDAITGQFAWWQFGGNETAPANTGGATGSW